MMRTTQPPIRLRSPAEVASAVPYLLGFVPTDSLVVVGLAGQRVLVGSRAGLPAEFGDGTDFRAVMDHLAAILRTHDTTGALLVGYGQAAPVGVAVRIATAALRAVGLAVHDAQRVADGRVFSLVCANPRCSPPGGTPFDSGSSIAAASAVAAGLVALPDRDALAQQLAPTTGPARAAFTAATHAAARHLREHLDATAEDTGTAHRQDLAPISPGPAVLCDGRRAVTDALDIYRCGGVLDTDRAAALTVVLGVPSVRDFAITRTSGEPWQISMWTDLLRRAEPAFAPGPAVLLALAALQAGNGALADCAIDRALAADPHHRLAHLVREAIQIGIDPHTVTTLVQHLTTHLTPS
jgi:hypothetical protein